MKQNRNKVRRITAAAAVAALFGLAPVLLMGAETTTAQVEEIEVNPVNSADQEGATTEPGNKQKASELWKETKQKSGEAASSAAEYSKVQSTRMLEASKTGLAKGADAVSTGSKIAWDATKEATKTAADYTSEKAVQAGEAISGILNKSDPPAPVSDKSIDSQ